jgi:RNA polymerase sigma-70 factor (ECF subfamily)
MGYASRQQMEQDATAFVMSVRDRLVGSLVLYCGDRAAAEDLAQEALARAWQRWSEVSEMKHPEAWVWRTAMNLANSRGRRLMAERRARSKMAARGVPALPDEADKVALREAVAALPKRQRRAIVCRYYAGFSVAQSAEAMGCKEGTVKALTSQGLASLRSAGLMAGSPANVVGGGASV